VTPPAPAPASCQVVGYIAPQEQFSLDLPVSGYTGQYLQEGCGALCGLDYLGSAGSGSPKPNGPAAAAPAASCTTVTAAAAASGAAGHGVAGESPAGWSTSMSASRATATRV
jgi:hypothetical protein